MILTLDVGNTNMTGGVFKDDEIVATFRMTTKIPRTSDEYGIQLCDLLVHRNFNIKDIDDDLFTDVCESLGGEQLSRIANCLNSDDVEAVRSAVLRIKQEMKNVLVKKINFYTECLNNLDK